MRMSELELNQRTFCTALKYMTLEKFLNRVSKYARCDYGTGCRPAAIRLTHTAQIYCDYLDMRAGLGYDLHNTVYQQPRDLKQAHDRMALEQNQKEQDKRLEEVKARYPEIRKNYRKLRNKYYCEADGYFIRPARSAEEIVLEGRLLHHCVGSDRYLRGHAEGQSYILMLRSLEDPEIPYITVEIDAKAALIRQWYGAHDKKPDEKTMQAWLRRYLAWLAAADAPRLKITA